jgi:hypothetical protein
VPDRERLLEALELWVDSHPDPDDAALSEASSGTYSPRQILHEVQLDSEFGRFIVRLVEHGGSRVGGIDAVLEQFSGRRSLRG